MPNVRAVIKNNEYQISMHEFYAAYHYAMQYGEWLKEYRALAGIDSVVQDGMPHGNTVGNPTEAKAEKALNLYEKIKRIEDSANEAGPGIERFLLMGVTCEGMTFNALASRGIPCCANHYYKCRRRFYYILSKKMNSW